MLRKLFISLALLAAATCAQASTYLKFVSDKGDYIGQGVTKTWLETDGTFTAQNNFSNGVTINFNGGNDWWSVNFAAPNKARLQVGPYENTQRWPFQSPTGAGLDVSGSGRGCNTSTGRFDILEISYTPTGDLDHFAANFEQHCEGAAAALRGSVYYKSTLAGDLNPKVTVTSGGFSNPVYVKVGQPVTVNVKVEANGKKNAQVERWAGFIGTKGPQWFNGSGWVASTTPQLAAVDFLQDGTFSYQVTPTAAGAHVFEYAVDEGSNHVFDAQYLNQLLIIAQ
ncbi:hypothetical protein SAMN02745857_03680 [Andreprevotia lacus DSM 23236]|jgi:hypothetical protein|uniref:Uncharacterized protein n=1 Tax=Andreprevotia lacus DSM 23236 TaxID=1121001 RepID=A0A1W1Y0D8_9NEIS|nr:hypothetical protein [Andreprevotia lacus]SMC29208.1 hypothetical protein SAMN02745857_03680 [Andreprevotia lacus DSM 23236]